MQLSLQESLNDSGPRHDNRATRLIRVKSLQGLTQMEEVVMARERAQSGSFVVEL